MVCLWGILCLWVLCLRAIWSLEWAETWWVVVVVLFACYAYVQHLKEALHGTAMYVLTLRPCVPTFVLKFCVILPLMTLFPISIMWHVPFMCMCLFSPGPVCLAKLCIPVLEALCVLRLTVATFLLRKLDAILWPHGSVRENVCSLIVWDCFLILEILQQFYKKLRNRKTHPHLLLWNNHLQFLFPVIFSSRTYCFVSVLCLIGITIVPS